MIEYIQSNKEWIFSGVGVFAVSLLIGFVVWLLRFRSVEGVSQRQRSGSNSMNIQSAGSVSIGNREGADETKPEER